MPVLKRVCSSIYLLVCKGISITEQQYRHSDIMNDSPEMRPQLLDRMEKVLQQQVQPPSNSVTLARRTLVLNSAGSGNSTLTGDSTSRSTTSRTNASHVLLVSERGEDSDDEDGLIHFQGVSVGPTYMSPCPLSNGLVLADIEENKQEEGNGGDSDIEGEDGKEFEEATVEAMAEKIQANTWLDVSKRNTSRCWKFVLPGLSQQHFLWIGKKIATPFCQETQCQAEWVVPNHAKRDEHAMYMAEFIENIE
jgi:hypothetical protein